jgi:hypothetical protein
MAGYPDSDPEKDLVSDIRGMRRANPNDLQTSDGAIMIKSQKNRHVKLNEKDRCTRREDI